MLRALKRAFVIASLSWLLSGAVIAGEERVINVYNWADYIAGDTLSNFEAETGIQVNYEEFSSNEVLEAKLLAGDSGFDVVVPSLSFLARQIEAGVFMPLDKSKLTNYANQDKRLLNTISALDPENTYSIPYLWGTTGIGYNISKVREIFGESTRLDSWDFVFDPGNLEKLGGCGVAFVDAPSEIIGAVLRYLGESPDSVDITLIKGKVQEHLMRLRPHIAYFDSSRLIDDLASGKICAAVGWSGDMLQASQRATDDGSNEVRYVIPKEGAQAWFDMLAIPNDAAHPDNAHRFLNYLLRPQVIADISNQVWYANGNDAAKPMIDKGIASHPGIYPEKDVSEKLYSSAMKSAEINRVYTRVWAAIKGGK